MPGTIRPALPHEGIALTDLVIRSKAYWGYDSAFLAASRPALTLTARRIAEDVVYVYQDGQQALGVYDLRIVATRGDVDLFFVAPAAIRTGVGRALWQHLVDQARHRGVRRLMIESDPFARGFYEAMGARIVGDVPSGAVPGRRLPLLEFAVAAAVPPDAR